jgi:hypothetical protein
VPKKNPIKKARSTEIQHELELDVVGLQHRVTTSTRRWLARKVIDEPIFCRLDREPENIYDENAIKVVIQEGNYKDLHLGYIQRSVASVLALMMDTGEITDVLLSITDIDVDKGTAAAKLQFTAPKRTKFPKGRKTA